MESFHVIHSINNNLYYITISKSNTHMKQKLL